MFKALVFLVTLYGLNGALAGTSRAAEEPATASALQQSISFINKVWKVVESPGGASGQLYVFLSDGTLVKASPEAVPELGKWSLADTRLKIIESAIMYEAEILLLEDARFRIRCHHGPDAYAIEFVLAEPSLPVHPVRFNPAEYSIRASGSEPSWEVRVEGDTARFRLRDEKPVEYTGGVWAPEDAASWTFVAQRVFEGRSEELTLTIRSERCTAESNAEYLLSATLTRGDSQLKGCAVAGKLRAGLR